MNKTHHCHNIIQWISSASMDFFLTHFFSPDCLFLCCFTLCWPKSSISNTESYSKESFRGICAALLRIDRIFQTSFDSAEFSKGNFKRIRRIEFDEPSEIIFFPGIHFVDETETLWIEIFRFCSECPNLPSFFFLAQNLENNSKMNEHKKKRSGKDSKRRKETSEKSTSFLMATKKNNCCTKCSFFFRSPFANCHKFKSIPWKSLRQNLLFTNNEIVLSITWRENNTNRLI